MTEERVENPNQLIFGEYKFGFHDDVGPNLVIRKGLNELLFASCLLRKMVRIDAGVPFEVLWSI